MREQKGILNVLISWDKLILLLTFIIPIVFFIDNFLKIIFITLVCVLSKSNLLNNSMKIEVHSFLIAVTAHLYGFMAGIFIAVVASVLQLKVGPYLKAVPNPLFVTTDIFYLSVLSFVAAVMPINQLMLVSLLTIILVDHILINMIRFATLPDKPKHWINSIINTVITYLLFAKFLNFTIAFLS